MALSKPGFLSNFLDGFGWNRGDWVNVSIPVFLGVDIDIRIPPFSFHPGDAIESAIDWTLSAVNAAIDTVYGVIGLASEKIGEIYDSVSNVIDWALERFGEVWDEITTIYDSISYAVSSATDYVNEKVADIYETLYNFTVSAIDAVREEVPELAGDAVDAALGALREQINLVIAFSDDIRELFTDPEDYILNKLESALDRFW